MRLPITLRMYAAEWPLIRAFGLAAVSIGFGLLAIMFRGALWPVSAEESRTFVAGTIAFLAAGFVAALMGGAAWELRSCPFAWNAPHLGRRLQREIRITGFILFGIAAGLGAAREGALVGASWFLAVAAALGYSVGLINALSRVATRFGGLVGLLLALVPMLLMPEIAAALARGTSFGGGFLAGMLGALLVILTTESYGALLTRRDDRFSDEADRGPDARLFGSGTSLLRAPRDGADRFTGTRRSDLDWLRALLHEQIGAMRGGLVGRAIRFAIATVITTFLIRIFFHALGALRSADMTTGMERMSEISLEWFTKSFPSRQEELFAINLVAVILGTVLWNRMSPSAAVCYPIARSRRAWIVWLATQADELAAFVGILVGFLATALIISSASDSDPWPVLSRFLFVATAVLALLPVTRWMRLRWLDARASPTPLDPTAEAQYPRAIGVYAVSMAVVIGGAILVIRVGEEAVSWLRAELLSGLDPKLASSATVVIVVIALVPIAILRWWWLVELRRFYRRNDLA